MENFLDHLKIERNSFHLLFCTVWIWACGSCRLYLRTNIVCAMPWSVLAYGVWRHVTAFPLCTLMLPTVGFHSVEFSVKLWKSDGEWKMFPATLLTAVSTLRELSPLMMSSHYGRSPFPTSLTPPPECTKKKKKRLPASR